MIASGTNYWISDSHVLSKDEMIANFLKKELEEGPMKATDIQSHFVEMGIGIKALKRVKKILGIKSFRKLGQWYWEMETVDGEN